MLKIIFVLYSKVDEFRHYRAITRTAKYVSATICRYVFQYHYYFTWYKIINQFNYLVFVIIEIISLEITFIMILWMLNSHIISLIIDSTIFYFLKKSIKLSKSWTQYLAFFKYNFNIIYVETVTQSSCRALFAVTHRTSNPITRVTGFRGVRT